MSPEELLKLWEGFIKSLKSKISSAHLSTYFEGTAPIELTDDKIVIGIPNAFIKETIEKKYGDDILLFFKSTNSKINKIAFKTIQLKKDQSANVTNLLKTEIESSPDGIRKIYINNKYTLDSFIVGDNNQLAYAAAKAVSKRPGTLYNPLFIYGGVGLGKTHLLQGIANKIKQDFPEKNILYVTAEEFTNQLIDSIHHKNVKNFRSKFRQKIDVLILDDIQFIEKKEKTQEEVFHTFNSLHTTNRQIIISSDKTPSELKTLEERLRSRFASGMVADITKPDIETRIAILRSKLQEKGYLVSTETLELIAETIDSNIRDLEAVLNQVMDEAELLNIEPSYELAKKIIKRMFPIKIQEHGYRNISVDIETVVNTTAEYFSITPKEIIGESRKKEVSLPRHIAIYICRKFLNMSLESIGDYFSGRNHTTIMHATKKINSDLKDNLTVVKALNKIKKDLGL